MSNIALYKLEQNCIEFKRIADEMSSQMHTIKSSYSNIKINTNLKYSSYSGDQMQSLYQNLKLKVYSLEYLMNQIDNVKISCSDNIKQLLSIDKELANIPKLIPNQYQSQSSNTIEDFNDELLFDQELNKYPKNSSQRIEKDQRIIDNEKIKQPLRKIIRPNYQYFDEGCQQEDETISNKDQTSQSVQIIDFNNKILFDPLTDESFDKVKKMNVENIDKIQSDDKQIQALNYINKNRYVKWEQVDEQWKKIEKKCNIKIPPYFWSSDYRQNIRLKGLSFYLTQAEIEDLYKISKEFRSHSSFSKFLLLPREQINKLFRKKLGIRKNKQVTPFFNKVSK